jgi:hypothetical protein
VIDNDDCSVVESSNMKPLLLYDDRHEFDNGDFAEIVIWVLADPVPGSAHRYKYRMAFIRSGECVVRMDNERGKGDHLHVGAREMPYEFKTIHDLTSDFWTEVWTWQQASPGY